MLLDLLMVGMLGGYAYWRYLEDDKLHLKLDDIAKIVYDRYYSNLRV